MDKRVYRFLFESNAIEDVWDGQSLDQAYKAWIYLLGQDKLTAKNIQRTHLILMKGKLDPVETGAWRRRPVWIGGKEGKPWFTIPELIEEWIKAVESNGDLAEQMEDNHVAFEAIHPFIDGNGRMGRLLLNWERVQSGLPVLVIWEAEKYEYYSWFI